MFPEKIAPKNSLWREKLVGEIQIAKSFVTVWKMDILNFQRCSYINAQ